MSMDAKELRRMAEVQREAEDAGAAPTNTRVDRVYKMFTPEERVRAIKAQRTEVEIGGSGGGDSLKIVIRPLSPKQFIEAFALIREVLFPIMALYGPGKSPGFADLLSVLGERIDKLPELVWFIIKRGNNITQEWVDNNMDLGLDLQLILPPFIIQNGLERFLGGTDAPLPHAEANGASTEIPAPPNDPQMPESDHLSTSSADTMDGRTSMLGTE